jgi:hypothetical protein
MYGCKILVRYLYILSRNPRPIEKLYYFFEHKFFLNILFDVDGLSYVCKMVEIHHKKKSVTSLISFSLFLKKGYFL